MKKLLLLVCLLSFAPACALTKPPVTIVTPAGQAAYSADQVITRLGELSDVVKANTGNAAGQISPADAFSIIVWISGDAKAVPPSTGLIQAIQTAAATPTPQGWKQAALQLWQNRIRAIFLTIRPLTAWVDVMDNLLAVIGIGSGQ